MATDQLENSKGAEISHIMEIAEGLGVKVGDPERVGSEANFVGIRSPSALVSRRLDSRTWFVQDQPDTLKRGPADYFSGSKKSLVSRGREVLKVLGIPFEEIAGEHILRERTRAAKIGKGGKVSLEGEVKGAKVLRIERAVEKCPVWSSSVTLRLGKDGRIVFLQAHWPQIADVIVEEAKKLAAMTREGWTPPAQEAATPEHLEAGIVHSPAAGFAMDMAATIRAIYEPWNQRFGRKLMLHFDRHGRLVPEMRSVEQRDEPALTRKAPDRD